MSEAKRRAWWSHKQGLDGRLAGAKPAEVFQASGWARSVGGSAPYMTLFARAGTRRADADRAVAAAEIHELPSARGCTYVLPASDFALGLTVAQQFAESEMKVARKLGVTDDEIARLIDAIRKALSSGPLDPEGIRSAAGVAARSLGAEGVKKGVTTTVPVALGLMQVTGDIRRIPVNGRLDQQRYKYALWKPNPLAKWKQSVDDSFVELAHAFFRWTGGATAAEFQEFSGLGVKAAKSAMEPLKLEAEADRWMLPEDRAAFEKFRIPGKPQYALVSSLDGIVQLRRQMDHAIMDRGELVGLWQFDPVEGKIVWTSTVKPDKAMRDAIERTEAFIREDLEDFRSFSLDSPKSRVPRIQALREGRAA